MKLLKWLYPGMKIKRWIFLFTLGILSVVFGALMPFLKRGIFVKVGAAIVIVIGLSLLVSAIKNLVRSLIAVFLPQREEDLVDILYKKRFLEKGLKIVAVGGGTGLSVILHGLKNYTSNITAIVTVADDGGSSGRLRRDLDVLPPGDIRNCLVALADAEPLMSDLFQYRFSDGQELKGHNFGNLFITALSKVTGDFELAIKESSKVLAIRGRVIPSTLSKVTLVAQHEDGTQTQGEANIPEKKSPIKYVYLNPSDAKATPEAIEAIEEADGIILGPGSLYTSILPNLLIKQIQDALVRSDAAKIYVCNVMTQRGETDNYKASDHIKTIIAHTRPNIINYCIVNTAKVPREMSARYENEGAYPVESDVQNIKELGVKVVEGNIISAENYVRHKSDNLSKVIIELISNFKK